MSYTVYNKTIHIKLSLTEPTSKARVKQRSGFDSIGQPVASRQRDFQEDFYLEWQIAYDTLDSDKSINKISFQRVKLSDPIPQTKFSYELSDYLCSSIKIGLLPKTILAELLSFGASIKPTNYIESTYHPSRKNYTNEVKGTIDFIIYNEELPVLVHDCGATFIEMMVQPKQRAVGSQAMLFFDIPITEVLEWPNLQGRPANTKEKVTFVIDENNGSILIQLAKCFMLASRQHNTDMVAILKAIKRFLDNQ